MEDYSIPAEFESGGVKRNDARSNNLHVQDLFQNTSAMDASEHLLCTITN